MKHSPNLTVSMRDPLYIYDISVDIYTHILHAQPCILIITKLSVALWYIGKKWATLLLLHQNQVTY